MNPRQTRGTALLGISLLAFGLGAMSGPFVGHFKRAEAREAQDPPAPVIRQDDRIFVPLGSPLRNELVVQQVGVTDSSYPLVLPASVEADPARTANVLPPVAGKVLKLLVKLGDHVKKGQPLVVIESGDLAQAWADDDKAREEVKRTKRSLDRARGLNQTGASAIKDLQQAETEYEEASAELRRTQSRLEEIGVHAGNGGQRRSLTLLAPTTGSVTSLSCSAGSFANDTSAALMTIANLDRVWVTANVPESDLAQVSAGEPVDVSLTAYPGEVLHGSVAFVSDLIEPDTRRCKVRMVFANPGGRLKPNMFASASFRVPLSKAVFVPNSALLMNDDSTVVFIEVDPWTFVARPVAPGYGEGDGTRIPQGLSPGDRIIVKGGVLLNG